MILSQNDLKKLKDRMPKNPKLGDLHKDTETGVCLSYFKISDPEEQYKSRWVTSSKHQICL